MLAAGPRLRSFRETQDVFAPLLVTVATLSNSNHTFIFQFFISMK